MCPINFIFLYWQKYNPNKTWYRSFQNYRTLPYFGRVLVVLFLVLFVTGMKQSQLQVSARDWSLTMRIFSFPDTSIFPYPPSVYSWCISHTPWWGRTPPPRRGSQPSSCCCNSLLRYQPGESSHVGPGTCNCQILLMIHTWWMLVPPPSLAGGSPWSAAPPPCSCSQILWKTKLF